MDSKETHWIQFHAYKIIFEKSQKIDQMKFHAYENIFEKNKKKKWKNLEHTCMCFLSK